MTLRFSIGRYTYFGISAPYLVLPSEWSDPENSVKNYDHMLHQSLDKIFRERGLSSSGQIKEFLRGPQLKSTIKPILDQEPVLSTHFSKDKLEQLPLLWIAVLGCYEQSAELLVRYGADVNELFGRRDPQVIDEKWTVLHVLLKMRPSPENERLSLLVTEHGADLQARDYEGRTVLYYAVSGGRVKLTEMLLEKGADVNAADNGGVTPLLAVDSKADKLLPLLMKHGANVFAKTRYGENVLHSLAAFNLRLCDTPVERIVDLAKVLIEKGISFDEGDYRKRNWPIHLAVRSRNIELVKLFLDHGANVNTPGDLGESPLHIAAKRYSNRVMLETLLKHGANINLKMYNGHTPLHTACEHAAIYVRHLEDDESNVIRLLVSAGAEVLDEDNDGKTPLALITSVVDEAVLGQEFWPLIEVLALKKALQPSIELKDERIIERHPRLRDYYRECSEEIESMKPVRFIKSCNFFELLTKSQCQIAAFMRNPEFESKFMLYDLNDVFPIYAGDMLRAFERAQKCYHAMLEQANVIDEAVYNSLPYLVVQKVVHYMFDCYENVK